MKFSWKIFFITFLIIITSFGVGGFLLINTVFTNTLNNRIDSAKKNNNYINGTFGICRQQQTHLRKLGISSYFGNRICKTNCRQFGFQKQNRFNKRAQLFGRG